MKGPCRQICGSERQFATLRRFCLESEGLLPWCACMRKPETIIHREPHGAVARQWWPAAAASMMRAGQGNNWEISANYFVEANPTGHLLGELAIPLDRQGFAFHLALQLVAEINFDEIRNISTEDESDREAWVLGADIDSGAFEY